MKKSLKIFIIFLITLSFLITFSYAEEDICKVSLTSDKTDLQAGDKVKMNISLSNIKTPDGILAIGGFLEFDSDVLEFVYVDNEEIKEQLKEVADLEDFEILYIGDLEDENKTPWYLISIEAEGGGMVAILGSSLTDSQIAEQQIAQIEFRVKSDAPSTSTTVKLSSIETIDATQTRHSLTKEVSTNYNITAGSLGNNNTSYYEEEDDVIVGSPQKDNTANEETPYTGIEDAIIPSMFVMAVIGTISFINYIKYKGV